MSFTPLLSNCGFSLANAPSSVVHTGVKSAGCEKSIAHLSPIQSWKSISPSVVFALKFGASDPNRKRGCSPCEAGIAKVRRRRGDGAYRGIIRACIRQLWEKKAVERREAGRVTKEAIRGWNSFLDAYGRKNVDAKKSLALLQKTQKRTLSRNQQLRHSA